MCNFSWFSTQVQASRGLLQPSGFKKKKKKKRAPSDPETDIYPLLQMILESKVHFSPQMPRIRAEPTRTTAVTLHDKCQTKTLADAKDYTSSLILLLRPTHFLTKQDCKNPMENLEDNLTQSTHLNSVRALFKSIQFSLIYFKSSFPINNLVVFNIKIQKL